MNDGTFSSEEQEEGRKAEGAGRINQVPPEKAKLPPLVSSRSPHWVGRRDTRSEPVPSPWLPAEGKAIYCWLSVGKGP